MPSSTIIHEVVMQRHECLDLVLELKLSYDAHAVFATTNSIKDPLRHSFELDCISNEITVLSIDICDSSIPRCLVYHDSEIIEIISLDPKSRDKIKVFSIEGKIVGCHHYGFFNTSCDLVDGDG